MAKYRKKPIVIGAIKLNPINFDHCLIFLYKDTSQELAPYNRTECWIFIKTLEGSMRAECGDYIIKGIKGEFYPCKPDIFEATYEKVTD